MTDSQVADDPVLLDQMMADLAEVCPLFAPTSYWRYYQAHFLPELARVGLRSFRRRRRSVLSGFNAVDLPITGEVQPTTSVRGACRLARTLTAWAERIPWFRLGVSEVDQSEITEYFYWHVREKFDRINMDLDLCAMSTVGDPEDVTIIRDQPWSRMYLQYCGMFADAARKITFSVRPVFAEIGAGLGRQIEVCAKLMPDATFLMFDIPPQLYVANQYLKAVFGARVIDYREANKIVPPSGAITAPLAGRIIVQPSWRLPAWSSTKTDVFWNSASFQEMEPKVVANYLGYAVSMRPEWVFINALPQGNYWGSRREGTGGTREPVTEEMYRNALTLTHERIAAYPTDYFLRAQTYRSYIFQRRSSN